MKKIVTKSNIENLLQGSSIYSTGGGIEYSSQKRLFNKLFQKQNKLMLLSLEDLDDNDYICTTYAVGSAGNTNFDLSEQLTLGLHTVKEFTKKRIKGIFAGETNIDILSFQAASVMGLPVIDADCTGGRAVPEIQFDNFMLADQSITPLVAISPDKKVIILQEAPNIDSIEEFVRNLNVENEPGLIAVFDHIIPVKLAKRLLTADIFRRAFTVGESLTKISQNDLKLKKLLSTTGTTILMRGKITKIELDQTKESGFLQGYYYITDESGNEGKMFVKNENIIFWMNNSVKLTVPDYILTVDTDSWLGIHNSKLFVGENLIVLGKPATKLWREEKAIKLFSPKHFGFKFKNKLL